MTKNERRTSPKLRALLAAACLGLMAIGASSASAAEPVTYNVTGVAHNAVVLTYPAAPSSGEWKCETLTLSGQVVQPVSPGPMTGTISKVTSSNCTDKFHTSMYVSLSSPWQRKEVPGGGFQVSNMNLHINMFAPTNPLRCDMVGPTRVLPRNSWIWTYSIPMTIKNVSVGNPYCVAGAADLEASFAMTYTKVS